MKKLFLSLLLLFAYLMGQAQVELQKGSKLQQVSGRLNIGLNEATVDIGLNYKRGWFLSPKFVLGPALEVGYTNTDGDGNFSFSAGGFVRTYFSKPDSRTLFFGEASLGLGLIPNIYYYASNDFTTRIAVGPGVSFRVGENVMLDFSLPYRALIVKDDQTYHNIDGSFGVSILLPAKK